MKVNLTVGSKIETSKGKVKILRVINSNSFLVISENGDKFKISITEIIGGTADSRIDPKFIIPDEDPKKVEEAKKRHSAVKALQKANSSEERDEISKEYNVNLSTIYRWKKAYENSDTLSSLYPTKRKGGEGKARINSEAEKVLEQMISTYYLTNQKPKVIRLIEKVRLKCHELQIIPPHESTIRRRVSWISEEEKHKSRYGRESYLQKYEYRGDEFEVDFPLQVVQIDHTPLDLILVTSEKREPLGRPHLTAAIDVYSRMIVGYYISFDPPGSVGTGICIANAILDKEDVLAKFNIKGKWPCWGVMEIIHTDNAPEFKGSMLLRSCQEYGIDLNWRGLGKTHWGGVIERFFKTLEERIYDLPGTTFNNTNDRENYDSEKESVMTLEEFEKWMLTYIVEIYHMSFHEGIGTTPMKMWEIGIVGDENGVGIGPYPIIIKKDKVKIDFLPSYKRTIQRYGVKINNIHYYSDVLRLSIGDNLKHDFKIDPRDISKIYFWNPEIEEYIFVPYRNLYYPSISIWEYRKVILHLKKLKATEINEELIFQAYSTMESIKHDSLQKSRQKRKERQKGESHINMIQNNEDSGSKDLDIEFKPLKVIL